MNFNTIAGYFEGVQSLEELPSVSETTRMASGNCSAAYSWLRGRSAVGFATDAKAVDAKAVIHSHCFGIAGVDMNWLNGHFHHWVQKRVDVRAIVIDDLQMHSTHATPVDIQCEWCCRPAAISIEWATRNPTGRPLGSRITSINWFDGRDVPQERSLSLRSCPENSSI